MNALAYGYLDLLQKGLFGGIHWKRFFVVLSNVGLLYFKDPIDAPMDLFPVLNCVFSGVDPEDVGGCTTVFRLEYSRKQVTFRCGSLSEYQSWTKAIKLLRDETESRRDTMKA